MNNNEFTTRDLMDRYSVTAQTVNTWRRRGYLTGHTAVGFGNTLFYTPEDVAQLEQRLTAAKAANAEARRSSKADINSKVR